MNKQIIKKRISILLIVSLLFGNINPIFSNGIPGIGVPHVDKETGETIWDNTATVASDGEAYNIAIQNTANYIYYLIKKYSNTDYYLLGEKPVFNITPEGAGWEQYDIDNKTDEYPNGKPLWKIVHNPDYFSNSMGICANTGDYVPSVVIEASSSTPICEFDKTGSYEVYYNDELLNIIKVHRKPYANFKITIGQPDAASKSDLTFNSGNMTNLLSYDLDEDKDLGLGLPGLTGEKYEYKILTDNSTWSGLITLLERTVDKDGKLTESKANNINGGDKNTWDRDHQIILVKHTVWDNQLDRDGKGQENFSVKYIGEGDPMADFNLKSSDCSNFIPLQVIQNSYDPSGLDIKQYNWEILSGDILLESHNDIEIDENGYITKVYEKNYGIDQQNDAEQYAQSNTSTNIEPSFLLTNPKFLDGDTYTIRLTVFNEAYVSSSPADKLAGKNKSQTFSRQFTYHKQKLIIDPNGGITSQGNDNGDGTRTLEIKQEENTEIEAPTIAGYTGIDGTTSIHKKFLYWDLSGNGKLVEKNSGNSSPETTNGDEVYLYTIGTNIKDTIKAIYGIGYTIRFHYPQNGIEKIQEMDTLYGTNRSFPAVTVIPQDAETWGWYYKPHNIMDETDIDEWIPVKNSSDTDKFYNRINNRYIDLYYKTKNVIVIRPDDLEEDEYKHIGWTRHLDYNDFKEDIIKEPLYVHKNGSELEVLTRTIESTATDSNLNKDILITINETTKPPKVKGYYIDERKDHVYKDGSNVIIDFFPIDNPDVTIFIEEFENVLFYIDYGFADGKVYKYNLSDLLKEENNTVSLATLSEIPLYEINPQTPPENTKWDNNWRYSKDLHKSTPVFDASSNEAYVVEGLVEDLERIKQTHIED